MDGTIIQQGTFTQPATAVAQTINLRSDIDWMEVVNITKSAGTTQWAGCEYYWQKGMVAATAANSYIVKYHGAATSVLNSTTGATGVNGVVYPGFLYYNSADQTPGAPVATTNVSVANPPVILTATTTNLFNGTIVRIYGQAALGASLNGCDFTINGITAATSFTIATPFANAVTAGGAAAGFYRIIANDTLFYPRRRVPCNITQAAQAVVSMTVTHDFTIGQVVRFRIPAAFGMVQLDGLTGTVVAINTALGTNTMTVNIDTTAMTAFGWPLAALGNIVDWAEVVPVGEDTAAAIAGGVDMLGDAIQNGGRIVMVLPPGLAAPGGEANDIVYWRAGKSFNT